MDASYDTRRNIFCWFNKTRPHVCVDNIFTHTHGVPIGPCTVAIGTSYVCVKPCIVYTMRELLNSHRLQRDNYSTSTQCTCSTYIKHAWRRRMSYTDPWNASLRVQLKPRSYLFLLKKIYGSTTIICSAQKPWDAVSLDLNVLSTRGKNWGNSTTVVMIHTNCEAIQGRLTGLKRAVKSLRSHTANAKVDHSLKM